MIWWFALASAQETAPPADDVAGTTTVEAESTPEAPVVLEAPAVPEAASPALPSPSRNADERVDPGTSHALLGNRLDADGLGGAVGVGTAFVFGSDGGVVATTATARYGAEQWSFAAVVPFASYRTSSGRTADLGNIRFEGYYRRRAGRTVQLFGAELHLPTGGAWTWAHDAQSLWPGGGLSAVYQRRQPVGPGDLLVRGSLGLHGTQGVPPVPALYVHASAVAGYEVAIVQHVSVLGELALSGWDPSPLDLTGLAGWEPVEGLRLRAGALLPLGAWMGLSPGSKPAGLREGTLLLDLSMRLR